MYFNESHSVSNAHILIKEGTYSYYIYLYYLTNFPLLITLVDIILGVSDHKITMIQ